MGYTKRRRTYDLRFSTPDLDGLQVRMSGISTGEYLRVTGMDDQDPSPAEQRFMFELLGERLVSWNLEDEDGAPVPTSIDAVMDLDFEFVMAIVDAWTQAIGGVDAPLDSSSPAGGPSPAASIPMAPLSPSPQHWSTPTGSSNSAVPSTFSQASS